MTDGSKDIQQNKNDHIGFLTVRGAILAGAIGGILYGVNFGLQVLVGIFKMTGATGFISGFTVPFFLVLASRMNRQWGTATIIWTLYSTLAIPTALMGTPGTYKLLVGFLGGLAYDLGFCGFRCRPWALYPALFLYVLVLNLGFYVVYALGLMPEVTGGSIIKVLIIVSTVFLIEGVISTFLANLFYVKRIKIMEH
jgi:hypothetical protein